MFSWLGKIGKGFATILGVLGTVVGVGTTAIGHSGAITDAIGSIGSSVGAIVAAIGVLLATFGIGRKATTAAVTEQLGYDPLNKPPVGDKSVPK